MAASLESLSASMQQLMQTMEQKFAALQAQLGVAEHNAQSAQVAAQQAQEACAASDAALAALKGSGEGVSGVASNATPHRAGLGIDTRTLGKPDHFDGSDAKWRDWCIVFKSYSALVNPKLRDAMEQAAQSTTPVTIILIQEPEIKEASSELYHLLINFTRGPALDRVINSGEYEGLEARRMLCDGFDFKLKSCHAGSLLELMKWDFSGDTLTCLEAFERAISLYQKQSEEVLSDNI